MFIYNIKINGSRIFKCFFIFVLVLITCILGVVLFKLFSGAQNSDENLTCIPKDSICKISASNYTNILKEVHENIDNYVGVKFNFSGYVYRVLDLNENQFVLSRDMIISSDFQSVIVGFLCEVDNAKEFQDDTWVEITGEITKGNYHGDMPIIKVYEIKQVDKPSEEYVYPPDESYIPTDGLI